MKRSAGSIFFCIMFLILGTILNCNSSGGHDKNRNNDTAPEIDLTKYFEGDTFEPWYDGPAYYSRWANGPSSDPAFFPIAVWLQDPQSSVTAAEYKSIGVNTFVGLWAGPTEGQLASVKNLGTTTICSQNTTGLNSSNRSVIKAWMHQDEPDNAQNDTQDPVPVADIISLYSRMKKADPQRPVYLNLGCGVASDDWYGRGNRTNHPEDYVEYSKGADILSFDIYPMNVFPLPETAQPWFKAFNNTVAQNIWYVAAGVDNLRRHCDYKKPVWAWLETTNFNGHDGFALTPLLVKAEAWMAIIHGAKGIGYFCHVFEPGFIEAGLLADDEMTSMVESINSQVTDLAPVLNTPTVTNGVTVSSSVTGIPVDVMVKRDGGYTYVFSVSMRPGAATAQFTLRGFEGTGGVVEVLGEEREVHASAGVFSDSFTNHTVHIYRIKNP